MEPAMRRTSRHRLELAVRPARYTAAAKVRRVCDRRGAQKGSGQGPSAHRTDAPTRGWHPLARLQGPPQAAPHTTRHLPPEQPRGLH
jgi:hypothetical protein